MIFVDMLRSINQHVCNNAIPRNSLDDALSLFGGIVFSNCFSPAPDTPRGLASIWTSTYPKWNGCDERIKWPDRFLNNDLDNIWKLFQRARGGFSLNLFLPKGANTMSFSDDVRANSILFENNDLAHFLNTIQIQDNSVTYINLNEYHDGIDQINGMASRMNEVYNSVATKLTLIYHKLNKFDFDIILIFSDHGCLLDTDNNYLPCRGRIQTYLQLFIKGNELNAIKRNNKLCSCMDIFPTIANLLGEPIYNRIDGEDLMQGNNHPYLVIEDYTEFTTTLSQVLGWWGIIFPTNQVITDYTGIWTTSNNRILSSEKTLIYEKILKNYASQYSVNKEKWRFLNGR